MAHAHPSLFQQFGGWILAALVGALLGAGLGAAFPAGAVGHHAAGAPEAPRAMIVRPDGSPVAAAIALGAGDAPAAEPPGETALPPDPGVRTAPRHAAAPEIPALLVAPFALLLGCIAVLPLAAPRFWHRRYPEVAFGLGSLVVAYYMIAFGAYGRQSMGHVAIEYYQFVALVIGLYFISGAVVVSVRPRGSAAANTALLAVGSVLASVVGTTGASMLLLRPFLRMNAGRVRPVHVVFFIFIVSNCGGALTPIGDPPLYLGFIKGVPFFWTLENLWKEWAFVNGCLLALFFAIDSRIPSAGAGDAPPPAQRRPVAVEGALGLAGLAVVIGAVFLDPFLKARFGYEGVPIGPAVQIAAALAVRAAAPRELYVRNGFTFEPAKEVGFLFVGIFATMAPALAFLAERGGSLGLSTTAHYYFATGALSAMLDNAPTYLSFLQLAFSKIGLPLTAEGLRALPSLTIAIGAGADEAILRGADLLASVSLGAVFFGACTYIGNGPNFMVKSVAESTGIAMPSFLGYLRYSVPLLAPVLVLSWLLFLR